MKPPAKQDYYTTSEAAIALGVSPPTVRRMIDDGTLAAYRFGKLANKRTPRRIASESLEELLRVRGIPLNHLPPLARDNDLDALALRDTLTSGQVGRLLRVAPRTVSKWMADGHLKGYRIPGSNDRRFPRDEVIAFCHKFGVPLRELASRAVLLVGLPAALSDGVYAILGNTPCLMAASWLEAGVLLGRKPACIVVDLGLGECVSAARTLRARCPDVRLVALETEERVAGVEVFDVVLPWPATAQAIEEAIHHG